MKDAVLLAEVAPEELRIALSPLAQHQRSVLSVSDVRRCVALYTACRLLVKPLVVVLLVCAVLGATHHTNHPASDTPAPSTAAAAHRDLSPRLGARLAGGGGPLLAGQSRAAAASSQKSISQQCAVTSAPTFFSPYLCGFGMLLAVVDLGGADEDFLQDRDEVSRWTDLLAIIVVRPLGSYTVVSEIGMLTRLQFITVEEAFHGTLPSQLGHLTELRVLDIKSLYLEGTLPSEVGGLPLLEWISFEFTDLHGPLPSQIGRLSLLTALDLWASGFDALPSQVGRLTALKRVELTSNALPWIPSEISLLTGLTALEIKDNHISQTVPSQLGLLVQLTRLDLRVNRFVGQLPSELGRLTHMVALGVGSNPLMHGRFPTQLVLLTALHEFVANDCGHVGGLELVPLLSPNVWAVSLDDNGLEGTLASEIGRLTNLRHLALSRNRIHSSLPSQFGLLTSLLDLQLGNNDLSGDIPTELLALPSLTDVTVEFNGFADTRLPQAAREVWTQSCDFSGVYDDACRRECARCPLGTIRTRACNAQGYGRTCVQAGYLLALAGAYAIGAFALMRRVTPTDTTVAVLAQFTVVALVDMLDLATDIAFAVASDMPIRGLSIFFLMLATASALVLSGSTLLNIHHRLPSVSLLGLTLVLSWLSPSALKLILGEYSSRSRLAVLVLAVRLVEDVPQTILQLVSIAHGVTTFTVIALVFSLVSVVTNSSLFLLVRLVRAPSVLGRLQRRAPVQPVNVELGE